MKLGIVRSRLGYTEQNGRYERMHRTLKAETTRRRQLIDAHNKNSLIVSADF